MKLKSLCFLLALTLFIPNAAQAVESCDDADIIADNYTECDIMFHQMFHELAFYQRQFEEPIQYETHDGQYSIHAFDVIVNTDKDIELHVFYEVNRKNNQGTANIHARQDRKDTIIYLKAPVPRLDEYNEYRSFEAQDINDKYEQTKAVQVIKLNDYYEPVTLYYKEDGLTGRTAEIETIDLAEALNFTDKPDETVSTPDAENLIETRNVFINIIDITREDDAIKIKYEATAKTLYNTVRLVNNRYVQLHQETAPDAFTELAHVIDTPRGNDSDKNNSLTGIPVGETAEIVKVVQLYDDTSPLTLQIRDIPSGDVVYTVNLSEYLEHKE